MKTATAKRQNTPGYNSRITVRIMTNKKGRRMAHYWGMSRRWLPMKLAEAEILLATDQAWDDDRD